LFFPGYNVPEHFPKRIDAFKKRCNKKAMAMLLQRFEIILKNTQNI